jgi:hypothetical protein
MMSSCRLLLILALLTQPLLRAYSVQTHEQLIDLNWKGTIKPFLLRRFPKATEAELERAHAYAYGGCAIQDLGYYPGGHEFFSDLTHYVRSADFIRNLFTEAKNPNELAFAVGALSHYVGDTIGHPVAVNPAVAEEFPKLAKRYGSSVAYDENPHAHVRAEFAFDINEISKHRMAPSAYLRHVGLRVPTTLLAKAFFATYGLNFRDVLGERRPVVRAYRFAVRSFLPRIAYAEVVLHRRSFPPDTPSPAFELFQKHLADADFEKGWNQYRKKPGFRTYVIAGVIWILPKIGPLSMLAIKGPTEETHGWYVQSVNTATSSLEKLLQGENLSASTLPNRDLDTGAKVRPGGYRLTDETYAQLLKELTRRPSQKLPVELKQDVLAYYANPDAPISTKKNHNQWAQVQKQLDTLRGMNTLATEEEGQ